MSDKCDRADTGMVIGENRDSVVVDMHDEDHQDEVRVMRKVRAGAPVPDKLYAAHSDGTVERIKLPVSSGPRQVATKAYRDGWEATFMSKGGSA